MLKYITGKEFNILFNDSINAKSYRDDFSRQIAKELIKDKSNSLLNNLNIQDQPNECYSDLLLNYSLNDKNFITSVEVKYRFKDLNIVKYKEHIIEIPKYNSFIKNFNSGNINNGYLISIFSENSEIWISNIFTDFVKFDQKYQNLTTKANSDTDGIKVLKDDVLFRPTKKLYYCFLLDTDTNKMKVLFDDKQFNVQYLNEQLTKSIELF